MNNSTENYERYEIFGTQLESDIFCSVNAAYDGFSATRDKNHKVTAPSTTSNYKQYSTTSFANELTSYNSQSIGHNANEQQMILEQNLPTFVPQLNRPSINSPMSSNASSLQIQTVEIPGYTIIIIPKSSSLASLTGLDVQHQIQPGNVRLDDSPYSVIPPQLNQKQNHSFTANGYESTPSPLKNLTNLDVQHQLQPGNVRLDNSSYSVNPPQLSQEQNFPFPVNGYEPTSCLPNLDVQHQLQPGNVRLDYSVNPPQHYFSGSDFIENVINNHVSDNVQLNVNDKNY
ncbi:10388_t:CDS:1 [Funneliformis caledonium]|uniref:10388_t:CDS:1 n=1 Tax=Funneliformis caledonium TaxID=1117310 RepID=A0A9N9F4W8_9GLOM|nr:10388_t:CDS:1 [Funneliformis caledonium]